MSDGRQETGTPVRAARADPRVPAQRAERERLRAAVREYVTARHLVPPLAMDELQAHADAVLGGEPGADRFRDFAAVLVGNEVWRETLAAIPYERRLLLIPQCLRRQRVCPAEMDEFGLLCRECGRCPLGDLQAEAEALGYVVLIAEGTTVVTKLLESGKVDAVIGVSCLSVLERAFPYMAAEAIPGCAIPLWCDGCDDTRVDLDWVREAMRLRSAEPWRGRIDLACLREEVASWFTPARLSSLLGGAPSRTRDIALEWLAGTGKRWRPLLAACAYQALAAPEGAIPGPLQRLAVAVECFHKASLVHDDIEDGDATRYGRATLHRAYGIPIALNAGDFLLGEGYRLIAKSGVAPACQARLLAVAADRHRELCLGQGDELLWMRRPAPLSVAQALTIFRRKTAPAFEVALRFGAICAGAGQEVCEVLERFSAALGVAYQIGDDLRDFHGDEAGNDLRGRRPSLLMALTLETVAPPRREAVASAWLEPDGAGRETYLRNLALECGAEEKARQLFEHYRREAVRALSPLRSAPLKSVLRRVVRRILSAEP